MHRRHTGIPVPGQVELHGTGRSPPDTAVARTAAWARATMDHWGLGDLADDVGLIVAEFSSNAWTHGSPPVRSRCCCRTAS